MNKLGSVVVFGLVVLGMGVEANASTSVGAALGQCKAEVKEKLGGDTRIALKGSKKRSGTFTVKLSVVSDGGSRQRLLCKVTDDIVVLTDKKGKPLS
jgi:hypothetical protein